MVDGTEDKGTIDNPVRGLFYSPVGTLGANPLIGPAHVLLVDFLVTEKFMARIVKDLDLPKINFKEVADSLHKIQNEILRLKGSIQQETDEQKKADLIREAEITINTSMADVKKTTDDFINKLNEAKVLPENEANKLLIEGAIKSMTTQMASLQSDINKTFAKIMSRRSPSSTKSPKSFL